MPNRNSQIDVMKGVLTLGMILAHTIFIVDNPHTPITALKVAFYFIKFCVDASAFPGFLFCFGFVSWVAYYRKTPLAWKNILRTSAKCYLAFIISGLLWAVVGEGQRLDLTLVVQVAAVRQIPFFSEFLLTFALVTLLGGLLHPWLNKLTEHWWTVGVVTSLCFAFTFVPANPHTDPLVSEWIGGGQYNAFPIVQYLPFFVWGIFAAKHPEHGRIYWGLALGSLLLAAGIARIPTQRFPPSFGWLLWSTALVLGLFSLVYGLYPKLPFFFKKYLNAVGHNTLFYLLLSNLVLIVWVGLGLKERLDLAQTGAFYVGLLGFIYFLQTVSVDLKHAAQSLLPPP